MDHHPDSLVSGLLVETGTLKVAVVGEFDMALRPSFEKAVAGATGDVMVDLGAVTFLDSAGIAALVEAWQAADRRGAVMRITDASTTVLQMLEITGLVEHLGLEDRRRPAS